MKIVGRSLLRRGAKFDIVVHQIQVATGDVVEREFIDHPGSVVLVPLLDGPRLVLIKNFRHTIGETILELPAGTAQRGEPLELTAERELIEETGYRAGKFERLMDFFACPGFTTEMMRVYLATELELGPPDRELDEEMETLIVPLDEAVAMTHDGRIRDAKSILGVWKVAERLR